MPRARKRLHGKIRKRSALKQSNPYTEGTTNAVDMSSMTAEERKLLMKGFKRKAQKDQKARQTERDKKTQREKDLEFVKSSTSTILKGEDPISQAFGLAAGGGIGGTLSKVAQARNLPIVKKTIDVLGKVKKAKTLGS